MDTCQQCAKPLPPAREPWRQPARRFCSDVCRAKAWRQRRAASATAPLDRAALLLGELQTAVQEAREALVARDAKGRRR